jgi:DNA-binding MarR family transcriptional regulator
MIHEPPASPVSSRATGGPDQCRARSRLENLGYLRTERDPGDGRARIIRYTEGGWHLFRTGSRLSHNVGQRWAQAIGQRRYDQFHATLRAIVDLTGEP